MKKGILILTISLFSIVVFALFYFPYFKHLFTTTNQQKEVIKLSSIDDFMPQILGAIKNNQIDTHNNIQNDGIAGSQTDWDYIWNTATVNHFRGASLMYKIRLNGFLPTDLYRLIRRKISSDAKAKWKLTDIDTYNEVFN